MENIWTQISLQINDLKCSEYMIQPVLPDFQLYVFTIHKLGIHTK